MTLAHLGGLAPRVAEHRVAGVPVLVDADHRSPATTLAVWLRWGSRHEADDQRGATHLLEHLLLRPPGAGASPTWIERVEHLGGEVNAATGKDFVCCFVRVPTPVAGEAAACLADGVLAGVTGDDGAFETERRVVLEELAEGRDRPDDAAADLLYAAVFDGGLAHPTGGTEAGVRTLTAGTVGDLVAERLHAGTVAVVASGAPAGALLGPLADTALAGLRDGAWRPQGRDRWVDRRARAARDMALDTCCLLLGAPGAARADARRGAYEVAALLLGGGPTSRLFRVLRGERGLVYAVYCWHTAYADTGVFQIELHGRREHLADILDGCRAVVAEAARRPPAAETVERAKTQLLAQRLFDWEATLERMMTVGRESLLGGSVHGWVDAVLRTGPDEVAAVYADLHDAGAAVACAGPDVERVWGQAP